MHWYGGTMAEAVNLSKQRNTIFVVFVEGDNDLSKELAATIDNMIILKRLSDPKNFLAVKLKSGSENYTYFAQIYQFVPVPSLFFIGRNGTPLEVVCAGVEPQSLATRIDRILHEHRKLVTGTEDKHPPPQPSTSTQNIRNDNINFIQAESLRSTSAKVVIKGDEAKPVEAKESSPPEPKVTGTKNAHVEELEPSAPAAKIAKTDEKPKSTEHEVVCDGDVCVRRPKDQAGPSTAQEDKPQGPIPETESASNIDDKMDRAKELIEARRKEKAAKEKEEERQKEMERRAVGQGVAELKKWQSDQELKQLQEDRKREKLENNLARQRILEQIAQDRAERKAREQPTTAPSPQTPGAAAPPPVGDACARARVQFKLPDGGAHTAHFDADAPLSALHKYLADNLQLATSNFSLWVPFPRRELTQHGASLRELQLAPSAALLVLPRRELEPAAPAPLGGVVAFLTQLFTSLILDPTYHIFSWLRNRIFSSPPPNTPSPNPASPTNPSNPSNPANPSSQGLRRRGNIHRITGDRSGEDDNNTWNGNSTQQM